jgi:hypothetical protein
VKFETTPAFNADFRKLRVEHRASLREDEVRPSMRRLRRRTFGPVATVSAGQVSLRRTKCLENDVVIVQSRRSRRIRFLTVYGELRCLWRRVGDHDFFKSR